jgi:hypothetical protein
MRIGPIIIFLAEYFTYIRTSIRTSIPSAVQPYLPMNVLAVYPHKIAENRTSPAASFCDIRELPKTELQGNWKDPMTWIQDLDDIGIHFAFAKTMIHDDQLLEESSTFLRPRLFYRRR